MKKLNEILTNRVVLYLSSRYLTYFIQFLSSIYIAVKLGPYYFGVWGFMLMLINYLYYFNFGISNSLNILLVQNKDNKDKVNNIVASSIFMIWALSLCIVVVSLFYPLFQDSPLFEKYEVGYLFYFIAIIGILYHFNTIFSTIYRVRGRLFEMAFQQSIIPFLVFIAIFMTTGRKLIILLLCVYIIGELLALFIFIHNKQIPFGGKSNKTDCSQLLSKGLLLFLYNTCVFFIVLSVRTFVSRYYSVEEFGFFTFSYTLANSILLLFQAFSLIIFPKLIEKFYTDDNIQIVRVISFLKVNSMTLSYGLIFLALPFFPLLLHFIPKYQSTLTSLNLTAISVVLYSSSFYSSLLMAKNKEKSLSIISIVSLIVSIVTSLCLVLIFRVTYEYVILSIMVSYFVFCFLTTYRGRVITLQKNSFFSVLSDFLPLRLFIPYLSSIVIIVLGLEYLIWVPLLIFVIFNFTELKAIVSTIQIVLKKPNIIDVK